jgi:hypothetical protein
LQYSQLATSKLAMIDTTILVNFIERLTTHVIVNHYRLRQRGSNNTAAFHGLMLPLGWMIVSVVKSAPIDYAIGMAALLRFVRSLKSIMCRLLDSVKCSENYLAAGVDSFNISYPCGLHQVIARLCVYFFSLFYCIFASVLILFLCV